MVKMHENYYKNKELTNQRTIKLTSTAIIINNHITTPVALE